MAGHVFISYSRTDRAYVDKLAAHLTAAGIAGWYDYQVETGESFSLKIRKAIDSCAAFVAVLSPASVASRWVQREISYADEKRKPMYPLRRAASDTPMELAGLQREDVSDGRMP